MITIGSSYFASSKFNIKKLIPSLVIGVIVAQAIGYLYSFISTYNPFAFFNLPLLIIAILLLIGLIYVIQNQSKSRNLILNMIIAALLSISSYYAQWTYWIANWKHERYFSLLCDPFSVILGIQQWIVQGNIPLIRFQSDGIVIYGTLLIILYALEMLLFLLPIALTFMPNIYCEQCQRYNYSFKLYTQDGNLIRQKLAAEPNPSGNYVFLKHAKLNGNLKTLLDTVANHQQDALFAEIIYSRCLNCKKNNYISLTLLPYKRDNKGKLKAQKIEPLIHNIAINNETNQLLLPLTNNAISSGKTYK